MQKHSDTNDISLYLSSVKDIPILTPDQELKASTLFVIDRKKAIHYILQAKNGRDIALQYLEDISRSHESSDEDFEEDPEKDTIDDEFPSFDNPENEELAQVLYGLNNIDGKLFLDLLKTFTKTKNSKIIARYMIKIKKNRDLLVKSNLRLVVSIAKRYRDTGLPFMDLIQYGTIGLIKAVDKYNPKKARISTMATWWVRQAVIRNLSNNSRTIRIPVHMVDQIHRSIRTLTEKLQRNPTPKEILEDFGQSNMTEVQVREVLSIMEGPMSFDTPIGGWDQNPGNQKTLADVLPSEENHTESLARSDLHVKLLGLFEGLSSREEKVLRLKIGL